MTRGLHGIRIGGVDKLVSVPRNSHPDKLGKDFYATIRKMAVRDSDFLRNRARHLEAMAEVPTDVQILKIMNSETLPPREGKVPRGWGDILSDQRGDIARMLSCGVIFNESYFIYDSLYCEYAYIANLDDMLFETYFGLQTDPHKLGRYAVSEDAIVRVCQNCVYQPCALVMSTPIFQSSEMVRPWLWLKMVEKLRAKREKGKLK